MRFELYGRDRVGTVTWAGPGKVELDVADDGKRRFFERFFASEAAMMCGPVGAEEMACERRDASPDSFMRALYELSAYSLVARPLDDGEGAQA